MKDSMRYAENFERLGNVWNMGNIGPHNFLPIDAAYLLDVRRGRIIS
jgi:hypothetical protein